MSGQPSRLGRLAMSPVLMALLFSYQSTVSSLQAAEHVVEIQEFKFVPDRLKVQVGDTITWINRDIAPHTATAMDNSWDTKLLKRGERMSIVASTTMKLDYFCRFHPHMKAKLVLERAP